VDYETDKENSDDDSDDDYEDKENEIRLLMKLTVMKIMKTTTIMK